jgi:hypothetical protein
MAGGRPPLADTPLHHKHRDTAGNDPPATKPPAHGDNRPRAPCREPTGSRCMRPDLGSDCWQRPASGRRHPTTDRLSPGARFTPKRRGVPEFPGSVTVYILASKPTSRHAAPVRVLRDDAASMSNAKRTPTIADTTSARTTSTTGGASAGTLESRPRHSGSAEASRGPAL